jgi:hypothetical protein
MDYVRNMFHKEPLFYLGDQCMDNVSSMDILGVTFTAKGTYDAHIERRIQKCRNSSFSLSEVGMCYPGLATETKSYLYRTICQPTLTYGLDAISASEGLLRQMDSTQGCIMKRVCGIPKRSHHSNLMAALNIQTARSMVAKLTGSLYYRIFQENSPTRNLCVYHLSHFIVTGKAESGTIVDRLLTYGMCPIKSAFERTIPPNLSPERDAVMDSLKYLLFHENFIKPWSNEYLLTKLLTKAF